MLYFNAVIKAVFLVAVPIVVSVYASLFVVFLTQRKWEKADEKAVSTTEPRN